MQLVLQKRLVLNQLTNNRILRKLQQQLLGTCILEVHCGLGILTCAFHLYNSTDTKALVLYHITFSQTYITNGSLRTGTSRGFTSAINCVATGRGF